MPRPLPIFYSALLLTGVNLLLRLVGTSFQVYISATLGPAGVGLLQLTMSVGSLAMVAGIAGIRTASMYLTAGELGQGKPENVARVLSACTVYSLVCSLSVASLLYGFAPWIAEHWIGDVRTIPSLHLFAAFLPVVCLCGVMTGYFTAANRIGTLAVVEIAEQLFAMAATMLALKLWAGADPGRACLSVILGSSLGTCLTLVCLVVLRLLAHAPVGPPIAVRHRLLQAAVPLALADILKSGISTAENLMVPRRLALNPGVANPLAAFGMLSGMIFPVMMFPACILFALAELLIPELARCTAAGEARRIRYLVRRSLKVSMLYGAFFCGAEYLLAQSLCRLLYHSTEAGILLRRFSLLIPMLYCDAITDAMTKGLGQQKICVRYNILTSALDVLFLFFLLPRWGLDGYYISFLATHLLNFILSLRRLLRISGEAIPFHTPALTAAGVGAAVLAASSVSSPLPCALSFAAVLMCLLTLFQVIGKEDIQWLIGLVKRRKSAPG